MVVTSWPSACTASTLHDFTLRPSRCTVQAPQLLVSQPMTVPIFPTRVAQVLDEQRAGFDVVGVEHSVDGDVDPSHRLDSFGMVRTVTCS